MKISLINPFKVYSSYKNRTQTSHPIAPLKCDTVSFAGKKKKQLIWKYDQNKVVKRLRKKGAPQDAINIILGNPRIKGRFAQFIQDYEEGKIKFSRTPREREIVFAISNEFSLEKFQKFMDWQDNVKENNTLFTRPLKTKEALAAIGVNATEEQIQRAITLSDRDEEGNAYLSTPITFKEGLYAAQNNYTDEQAEICYALMKKHSMYARSLVENEEKFKKLQKLTKNSGYTRNLTIYEAAAVINRQFTDKQIEKFISVTDGVYDKLEKSGKEDAKVITPDQIFTIIKNNLNDFQTYYYLKYEKEFGFLQIVKDENVLKRFLELVGEYGELKTSRPLTVDEAMHVSSVETPLKTEQIQKYIDLLDAKADKYIAKSLVTNFWEYKDVSDIQKLDNNGKRRLLKKIMTETPSLFHWDSFNSNDFSLIPKNQKEYCKIVSALANSIGMETKELSKKELETFNISLSNLIEKISTADIDRNLKDVKNELEGVFVGLSELKGVLDNEKDTQKTLRTFQKIASSKDFRALDKKDQKTLAIATLLHNLNKKSNERIDIENSAFDAFYVIQRLNLDEVDQLKIYEIIKNQNWQENFTEKSLKQNYRARYALEDSSLTNSPLKDIVINEEIQKIAQDVAFETRHSNTFELTKILSSAILKAGGSNLDEFNAHSLEIKKYLDHIQKSQIFLPQAKFPKASEIKNGEIIEEGEIKNVVLDIDKCDFDLEQYGFEEGTTKDNLYMLVHGLDAPRQLGNFSAFSIIDTEALLSTSYMKPENHRVFRQQGIILDVHTNNVHAGYCRDFGSGCSKTLEIAKKDYIFATPKPERAFNRGEYRGYISNLIKEKLNISDDEYIELVSKLQNLKSWTSIQKYNSEIADALKSVFDEMELGKRRHGRMYNEVLVSRPKIQAVYSYGQKYEEIPAFLKKYAADNDLPVILLGD